MWGFLVSILLLLWTTPLSQSTNHCHYRPEFWDCPGTNSTFYLPVFERQHRNWYLTPENYVEAERACRKNQLDLIPMTLNGLEKICLRNYIRCLFRFERSTGDTLIAFLRTKAPDDVCDGSETFVYEPETEVTYPVNFNFPGSIMCHEYAAKCPSIPAPVNGGVVFSDTFKRAGSLAHFSCGFGYTLQGEEHLMCVEGSWNGTAPTCALSRCSNLNLPKNGQVFYLNNRLPGSQALFRCDAGYTISQPNDTLVCNNSSLHWSGVVPQCTKKAHGCSELVPPNGSFVTYIKHDGDIAAVEIGCKDGFKLHGSSIMDCQNGTWPGDLPNCTGVLLNESLSDPTGSNMSASIGVGYRPREEQSGGDTVAAENTLWVIFSLLLILLLTTIAWKYRQLSATESSSGDQTSQPMTVLSRCRTLSTIIDPQRQQCAGQPRPPESHTQQDCTPSPSLAVTNTTQV